MGDPAYLFRERAERGEVKLLSSNFPLYADMSQRVMHTLESFAPGMEIYSIDEAFFLLEESPDLEERAIAMRRKVKQWTGIPVSFGIGPTKTIAKLANKIAKKNRGVMLLTNPETIREWLEKTPVGDVWGIGGALSAKLQRHRIYTAGELAAAEGGWIRQLLGVQGYRTLLELGGVSCIPLAEEREKRKSIVCSRSFREPVKALPLLQEAIAAFASRAAEKLREEKSAAGFLSVFIATSPFRKPYVARSCHVQIPNPTSYTPDLIRWAKEGVAELFALGNEYKKAGVLLGDFSEGETSPLDLFTPDTCSEKKKKAMEALDRINRRYDKPALRFAAEGSERKWKSAPQRVSPKFTTSWHDLLKVR